MDYFRILNLTKEPFSNSPDPDLFYQSKQHLGCLQQLELSLRLRRGLNVVIGDVGTGKTTLCRQLIRRFSNDDAIETHLILDPHFSTPSEFLFEFAGMLVGRKPSRKANNWQIKEAIKKCLFRKGVDENRIIVLIIDEGQKIPVFCLEILRELLNYETNDRKLLQIVIFAQKEFETILKDHPNFSDRINLYHFLPPLSFRDTRLMIRHRLNRSGASSKILPFFSFPSLWVIYRATGGYPRKIVTLCHRSLLAMIIQNRTKAGWLLVRSCVKRVFSDQRGKWRQVTATTLIISLVVVAAIAVLSPKYLTVSFSKESRVQNQADPLNVGIAAVQSPLTVPPLSPSESETPFTAKAGDFEDKSEIEIISSVADTILPYKVNPPLTLGRIAIQQWETLGGLVQKIYGKANPKYLDLVTSANPYIDNPDNMAIGDIIYFPAVPVLVKSPPARHWWVEIGKKESLEEAFRLLRSYKKNIHPIRSTPFRLIPYWSSRIGLKISVVLTGYYTDKNSAYSRLDELNKEIAPEGKVVSLWDEKMVYFADPFLIGKRKTLTSERVTN